VTARQQVVERAEDRSLRAAAGRARPGGAGTPKRGLGRGGARGRVGALGRTTQW